MLMTLTKVFAGFGCRKHDNEKVYNDDDEKANHNDENANDDANEDDVDKAECRFPLQKTFSSSTQSRLGSGRRWSLNKNW